MADPVHTQVAVYWRFVWIRQTHPYPRLIACTNKYSSFTLTSAFLVHACIFTRNLRAYFSSVGRIFLVETVVLQTVLWDIQDWSARFLIWLYSAVLCGNVPLNLWQFVVRTKTTTFLTVNVCVICYILAVPEWSARTAGTPCGRALCAETGAAATHLGWIASRAEHDLIAENNCR